jgi:hypothetical protein
VTVADDGWSPANWDGRTRYSEPMERRADYEALCLSCGRGARLNLTEAAARQWRAFRCTYEACGGRVMLEGAVIERSA